MKWTVLGETVPPPSVELLELLSTEGSPTTRTPCGRASRTSPATRLFDIVQRGRRSGGRGSSGSPPSPRRRQSRCGCRATTDRCGSWRFSNPTASSLTVSCRSRCGAAVAGALRGFTDARQAGCCRSRRAVGPAPPAARLSEREHQVLDRLAEGASNQDIADALHISPGTVRKHLENIYAKLEVTSRMAALARTGRTTSLS